MNGISTTRAKGHMGKPIRLKVYKNKKKLTPQFQITKPEHPKPNQNH